MKKLFTAALAMIALTASPATPPRMAATAPQDASQTRSYAPHRIRIDDIEGRNLQLLLREDFSKFTAGTEETPDSKDLCEAMYEVGYSVPVPDEYMSTPGWTGAGIYQAGGTAALAIPRMGGCLNTPPGDFGVSINSTTGQRYNLTQHRLQPAEIAADAVLCWRYYFASCRTGVFMTASG